jgi:hypothetical protein
MSATERFEFDSIANQVGVSQTARAVYEKNKSHIHCIVLVRRQVGRGSSDLRVVMGLAKDQECECVFSFQFSRIRLSDGVGMEGKSMKH